MNANIDMKFYRERWKAVKEAERQGITKHNLVERLLINLGIKSDNNVDQMQIILRWAKLKDMYEQEELKNPE